MNWAGYTCADMDGVFCENGAGKDGMSWGFGEFMGFPENNCCVCGKGETATCSTYTCPYGYLSRSEQASSTTLSDSNCCQAACAGYVYHEECPVGMEPNWDHSSSTTVSDENCCKPAPLMDVRMAIFPKLN